MKIIDIPPPLRFFEGRRGPPEYVAPVIQAGVRVDPAPGTYHFLPSPIPYRGSEGVVEEGRVSSGRLASSAFHFLEGRPQQLSDERLLDLISRAAANGGYEQIRLIGMLSSDPELILQIACQLKVEGSSFRGLNGYVRNLFCMIHVSQIVQKLDYQSYASPQTAFRALAVLEDFGNRLVSGAYCQLSEPIISFLGIYNERDNLQRLLRAGHPHILTWTREHAERDMEGGRVREALASLRNLHEDVFNYTRSRMGEVVSGRKRFWQKLHQKFREKSETVLAAVEVRDLLFFYEDAFEGEDGGENIDFLIQETPLASYVIEASKTRVNRNEDHLAKGHLRRILRNPVFRSLPVVREGLRDFPAGVFGGSFFHVNSEDTTVIYILASSCNNVSALRWILKHPNSWKQIVEWRQGIASLFLNHLMCLQGERYDAALPMVGKIQGWFRDPDRSTEEIQVELRRESYMVEKLLSYFERK